MGTRGTLGFKHNGVMKVAYNHFDSYPTGLGNDVLDYLHTLKLEDYPQLCEQVDALQAVEYGSVPTPEQIAKLAKFTNLGVSNQSTSDWYCLLRGTQGDLAAMLEAGYFEPWPNATEEWSYLVDLDAGVLEVWEGPERVRTYTLNGELPADFAALEAELYAK